MNSNPLFDFCVNRENNSIHLKRALNAGPEWVWKAWKTAGLPDQWFGPKPSKPETISMDSREGGFWLYALTSTEYGQKWGRKPQKMMEWRYMKVFTAVMQNLDELFENIQKT